MWQHFEKVKGCVLFIARLCLKSVAAHFNLSKTLKKLKTKRKGRFYTMKRRIKTILSLAVAAITATAAITAQAAQFSDISPDHWAYNSVTKMAERGVFSGYEDGTFRPGQAMTHEEFVKTIVEYVAPNSVTPKGADYQQVSTDDPTNPQYWTNHWSSWAQPYLDKALELGLIGDGSDASNKKIATLLDDYDEIINGTPVAPWHRNIGGGEYEDYQPLPLEIDLNDTDNIAPNTLITREEVARLVTRALYLTRDNEHLYDNLNNTPFKDISGLPYTLNYKYASFIIGQPTNSANYPHSPMYGCNYVGTSLAGVICDMDIFTGSTNGNGVWGVTPDYRRDVLVALANGILSTDENGMYNPQQAITRAEAAAVILRLSDKSERLFDVNDDRAGGKYMRTIARKLTAQNRYSQQLNAWLGY